MLERKLRLQVMKTRLKILSDCFFIDGSVYTRTNAVEVAVQTLVSSTKIKGGKKNLEGKSKT